MKNTNKTSYVSRFTDGVASNEALEQWLAFNQSLEHPNWVQVMAEQQSQTGDEASALNEWLKQIPAFHISLNYFRFGAVIAAVFGVLGMAGALQYSGEQPVNVWLLLALFAIVPFLMTLLTMVGALLGRRSSMRSSGAIVEFLAARLHLDRLKTPSACLIYWIQLKFQTTSLAFTLGGLLGFLWLATFQDFTFGWSSTLIRDVDTMTQTFNLFSSPWSWALPQPSEQLVINSQFFRGQDLVNAAELTQWWQVIVAAIVTYGLLPRLLVMLWFHYRFKKALAEEIANSTALVRFFEAYRHEKTQRPLTVTLTNDDVAPSTADLSNALVIGWQRDEFGYAIDYVLGQQSWDADNAWLQTVEIKAHQTIFVCVYDEQTPTGELADCLHTLQSKGQVEIGVRCILDATRSSNALQSWRAFAQKEKVVLAQLPEPLI